MDHRIKSGDDDLGPNSGQSNTPVIVRALLLLAPLLLPACDDMAHQPKQNAYANAAGDPVTPPAGIVRHREAPQPPPELTMALLQRGQERYRIACVPCHGQNGDGNGMVVQRGFPPPPSYHGERLQDWPTQRFYDVITNGHGAMYSYAARVAPNDRWAIVAYIRALQLGNHVPVASLRPDEQAALP